MAKIHVLEKHIAELIAAGEVVERPASVVKELLENAIDAGATQIMIAIESGGVRLIEISDNGSGIETEYIGTAFIRHATSKIQQEDDLNRIATLGFRGEALASIASVARVEVLTKTEEDEFACSYCIEGGEELGLEVSARAVGTTIRVRDLFYNTPARMKFLKKDASEGTFVADLVAHVALSHPEISFKFTREGKLQYVTPGDKDLKSAAYAVLGRDFARDLVSVEDSSEAYHVSGYVSPPKNCRASRSMQYFYINGRYVKNRTMMAALETAYKGTLMHGKFPGCVLSLQMPVDMIDVNVHPAKTEVRFAREKDVFEAVYRAVKGALSQTDSDARLLSFTEKSAAPQKPFSPAQPPREMSAAEYRRDILQMPVAQPVQSQPFQAAQAQSVQATIVSADAPIATRVTVNSTSVDAPATGLEAEYYAQIADIVGLTPTFTPTNMNEGVLDITPEGSAQETRVETQVIAESSVSPDASYVSYAKPDEIAVPEALEAQVVAEDAAAQTSLYQADAEARVELSYVGEAFKTYILAQQGDALYLIDKHAAHERMLYETLIAGYGNVASQMLLEAVTVNLSAAEKQALLEHVNLLESAGLEIDDFGGTTVLVRAVPADIVVNDVENLTVELAAKLVDGAKDALSEKTQWVFSSISCRAAIKAGDRSDASELMHLAERIISGEIPAYCPHGRPCVITLIRKELEKQFGRIVS